MVCCAWVKWVASLSGTHSCVKRVLGICSKPAYIASLLCAFLLKWTSIHSLSLSYFPIHEGDEDHPVPPLPPSPAILLLWVWSWWPNWSDSTVQTVPYCPIELEGRFISRSCSFFFAGLTFNVSSGPLYDWDSILLYCLGEFQRHLEIQSATNKSHEWIMRETIERVNTQSNTKEAKNKKLYMVHYV